MVSMFAWTNVSASQATPKRAIKPVMPLANTGAFITSPGLMSQSRTMSRATVSMMIWMDVVTSSCSNSSGATSYTGRNPSNSPSDDDRGNTSQEDVSGQRGPGLELDRPSVLLARFDFAGGEPALVLRVILEFLAQAVLEEGAGDDGNETRRDRNQEDVRQVKPERLHERYHHGHRRRDGAGGDSESAGNRRRSQRPLWPDAVRVCGFFDHRE